MNKTLIFIHIEKTAGRSINQFIDDYYGIDRVVHVYPPPLGDVFFDATFKLIRGPAAIVGHVDFGIHRVYSVPAYAYCTFLRHPVERLISEYHYFRRRNSTVPKEQWRKKNHMIASCARALDFAQHPDRIVNPMGARVCGKMFQEEVSLERAKENITNWFAFVGITEDMAASVRAMENVFGCDIGGLPHINRTDYEGLDPRERRELEDYLESSDSLDFELYEWCRCRL